MLNKYLEEHFNDLKEMAFKVTSGVDSDDLLQFVIVELYKCNQKSINEIIKKKHLTFYIARIMINQAHSSTSRFYYKYKKYYKHHIRFGLMQIPSILEDTEILEKELIEEKLEWIDLKLKDCYWFDTEVFKLYYEENHSLNSMAKATGINRNTLFKSINSVKKYLINEKD
jgi:DNA-directed RNA polymerase specialized sigma24 family protein